MRGFLCLKFITALLHCFVMIFSGVLFGLCMYGLFILAAATNPTDTPSLYILIGFSVLKGVLTIATFWGIFGTLAESQWMLSLSTSLLFFCLLGQIAASAWTFANYELVEDSLTTSLDQYLDLYEKDDSIRQVLDLLQQELECCGSSGPDDWDKVLQPSKYATNSSNSSTSDANNLFSPPYSPEEVPVSCCINGNCGPEGGANPPIYTQGCSQSIVSWLESNRVPLLSVALSGIVAQGLVFVLTLLMCVAVRKIDKYAAY